MIKLFRLLKCRSGFSACFSSQPLLSLPSFSNYNLIPSLQDYLTKHELTTPTPIQDLSIPEILKDEHQAYYIAAQSGTGKSLSYLLPVIQKLKLEEERLGGRITQPNRPSIIIIVPSKELVAQTVKFAKAISHHAKFKAYGLQNYDSITEQKNKLKEGVDILVTTLDRLETQIERKNVFISKCKYLVIDECDTFVDAGFKSNISHYIQIMQQKYQQKNEGKIIFVGATYTGPLNYLFEQNFGKNIVEQEKVLKKLIEKKTHQNLSNLTHEFIQLSTLDKFQPMLRYLREELPAIREQKGGVIIFTNTIPCCQSLDYVLADNGFKYTTLHGDIPKRARDQMYRRFESREVDILLCTDLGSRGLDFPFVTHVVNFDFPLTNADYLHRAGRAGRAGIFASLIGKQGKVVSLFHQKNLKMIQELQQAFDAQDVIPIRGSSYSLINKEIIKRQQELNSQGENYLDSDFQSQKRLQDMGRQQLIPSGRRNLPVKKTERPKKDRGYIPMINKDKEAIKRLSNKISSQKKHERINHQNSNRKIKWQIREIRRKVQREQQKEEAKKKQKK